MSSGDPRPPADSPGRPLSFYITLGFFGLGVGLILMILLTLSGFGGGTQVGPTVTQDDDPLDVARDTLTHNADVSACRAALQQINVALGSRPDAPHVPALDPKRRERLQQLFGLTDDEMKEVGAEAFTQMDGWRLDEAFLLRDAATHALQPQEEGDDLPTPTPLERASAAFAWVVREVRLAAPTAVGVVPPQFALRRGSGTALERAVVFLDLLQQLGVADEDDAHKPPRLLGCLVILPDSAGESPRQWSKDSPRLWACGVVVGDGPDVYLFDPLLGLPLPGEDGKGVATLAAVCQKPALLEQLNADPAHRYDVTAEQARTAELRLVCSLSEMAPRMQFLEEKVLPPVRVRLGRDPEADLKALEAVAQKTEGAKPAVKTWPEGVGLLRRFLAPDEGGVDPVQGFPLNQLTGYTNPNDQTVVQMQRFQLFQLQLAPWDAMPPLFRDLSKFPYNVGLGRRVRDGYMQVFLKLAVDPQGPRDLMLRGDFDKAASDLVGFNARLRQMQDRLADAGTAGELEKEVNAWVETARHAYADQLRAQEKGAPADAEAAGKAVDEVWKKATPVFTVLQGASAGPGLANVTYLLGLSKHEKAEQAQTRLELLARQPGLKPDGPEIKEAREDARTAWMDALGWWKKYGDDHPEESLERPSSSPGRAAAVRQMRAEAQAMLGDWKAAAATYEDLTEPMEPAAKVAALYQARRLKKEHGPE